MSIDEALEGWFLHLRQKRCSPHTLDRYGRVWRKFRDWLNERGVRKIEDLKAEHARLFIIQRFGHLKSTTAHYDVTPLKSFSRWLEDQDLLADDPFRRVKRPKMDKVDFAILQPEEAKKLLSVFDLKCPDDLREYTIVSLTLDTGLRRSEVIGARLADLDLEDGSLQVMGKGRKQRRVPISAEVSALLWKYTKTVRPKYAKSDYLFVSRRGGPLDARNLSRRFSDAVRRSGIGRRVRFHDLRHTCATWCLRAGAPKERVSRMLGHSSDSVTSIYEHLDYADVAATHQLTNPLRLLR